jgi:TonB family protein
LDRAALVAVRRGSPFPMPPRGATRRQLRFTIPFNFR